MMRLIDADRLKETMAETLEGLKIIYLPRAQASHLIAAFDTVGEMVDDCSTIDAVPVVRCKDCKYYYKEADGYEMCDNTEGYDHVTEDGFCAWAVRKHGERKDDETD